MVIKSAVRIFLLVSIFVHTVDENLTLIIFAYFVLEVFKCLSFYT